MVDCDTLIQSYADSVGDKITKLIIVSDEAYSMLSAISVWDVVSQIVLMLKTSEGRYSVEHIKGHQDNKCDYEELDWKSQQNVVADAFASSFLSGNPQFCPLVPCIASNPVQL
eukprot:3787533-Ditylum_brightwellii.AAC.1